MFLSPAIMAEEGEKRNLLLLHSYQQDYEWTKESQQGIMEQLATQDLIINQEYMDTKRIADEKHFANLFRLYQHKYQTTKFDLIIATDNHAFDFLLQYRNQLFGKVPVVFTGVNNLDPVRLENHNQYYGLAEDINIEATVKLALELHSDADEVIAFFSNSLTGQQFEKKFKETVAGYPIMASVYKINNLADVKNKLDNSSENSIIFTGLILNDSAGDLIAAKEAMQQISNTTTRPIYSFWEFYLGHGIVGGKLLSAYTKGQATAKFALNVLDGGVEDKTIVTDDFSRYEFDHNQLESFGIKQIDLPPASQIVNHPTSFYYQYKRMIWLVVAVFIVLSILIVALIIYMNKYRTAMNKLDDIFLETNLVFLSFAYKSNKLVTISKSCFNLYGYSQSDFLANNQLLQEVIFEPDLKLVKSKKHKLETDVNLDAVDLEYRINKANGEERWVREHSILFKNNNNEVISKDSIISDITERKEAEEELIRYANYDVLTGVYNRRMGLNVLERNRIIAQRQGVELTVCFLDLNNLKFVNDTYGHEAGDRMIKTVVEIIGLQIRDRDTLIRLGGDEFLISFLDCSIDKAESIWGRIINDFKEINGSNDFPYRIVVSHGLAQYNRQDSKVDTIEKIINLADKRMYQEKENLK
jgi:diguanylate cyclase (GGDEF)-like protein/PAS domain S-box-containing protein